MKDIQCSEKTPPRFNLIGTSGLIVIGMIFILVTIGGIMSIDQAYAACPCDCDDDGYVADSCGGNDCDDGDHQVNPGETEIVCNSIDDDCNPATPDEDDWDGDCGGGDCENVCDDCAPYDSSRWQYLTGYTDGDGDGYGSGASQQICSGASLPTGYSDVDTDCDDGDPQINPGKIEIMCNGIDDNCNPATPDNPDGDGDAVGVCSDCDDANTSIWQLVSYYPDSDYDDYGTGTLIQVCAGAKRPLGYAVTNDDCDDNNGTINPGATENCTNGQDDDCDGNTDGDDSDCPASVEKTVNSIGEYYFGGLVNATVNCTSLSSPGAITIVVHPGESHPQANGDSVQRWFEIACNASGTFTLTLSYEESELNGEEEGILSFWRYAGGTWYGPYGDVNIDLNTITVAGVTEFSDWVISDAGPQPPVVEWATILLITVGILSFGGFIWYRKQKMAMVIA